MKAVKTTSQPSKVCRAFTPWWLSDQIGSDIEYQQNMPLEITTPVIIHNPGSWASRFRDKLKNSTGTIKEQYLEDGYYLGKGFVRRW
jgi:hypothetical protein